MSRFVGLVGAVVILVAACGGSSDVTTTTLGAQPSAVPPPSTTATSEPAQTVDAPELGGTSWNVTNYVLPSGSFTNVWLTDVTISFAADGTLSGSAGCNDYQATWAVSGPYDEFESGVPDGNDGQTLNLESLSWTEVVCENESIMEQEAEILDLLQRGARWVLIRESFHLRDADGAFLFEAAAQ
jgi:heat shock protein HslJ